MIHVPLNLLFFLPHGIKSIFEVGQALTNHAGGKLSFASRWISFHAWSVVRLSFKGGSVDGIAFVGVAIAAALSAGMEQLGYALVLGGEPARRQRSYSGCGSRESGPVKAENGGDPLLTLPHPRLIIIQLRLASGRPRVRFGTQWRGPVVIHAARIQITLNRGNIGSLNMRRIR